MSHCCTYALRGCETVAAICAVMFPYILSELCHSALIVVTLYRSDLTIQLFFNLDRKLFWIFT